MKSLCKVIKKLFKAKAHFPRPDFTGKNMEIGVDVFTSVQDISWEIEYGPTTKGKLNEFTACFKHKIVRLEGHIGGDTHQYCNQCGFIYEVNVVYLAQINC